MLQFSAYVVRAYIPVLLVLDVMKQCGLVLDFEKDEILSPNPSWHMQMVYKLGHAFATTPRMMRPAPAASMAPRPVGPEGSNLAPCRRFYPGLYVHYSQAELTKLHINQYHPSASKLFALIKIVNP